MRFKNNHAFLTIILIIFEGTNDNISNLIVNTR